MHLSLELFKLQAPNLSFFPKIARFPFLFPVIVHPFVGCESGYFGDVFSGASIGSSQMNPFYFILDTIKLFSLGLKPLSLFFFPIYFGVSPQRHTLVSTDQFLHPFWKVNFPLLIWVTGPGKLLFKYFWSLEQILFMYIFTCVCWQGVEQLCSLRSLSFCVVVTLHMFSE